MKKLDDLDKLGHVLIEPDFEVPPNHDFDYSPEELRRKMGQAAWEYEQASRKVRRLETTKNIREKKTAVILSSRRFHLLTDEKLRGHLIECFNVDPKFRLTKELFEHFIYVEHQELFNEYSFYERIAKQAEKEHDMWSRQLSYHQSLIKREAAELASFGKTGE